MERYLKTARAHRALAVLYGLLTLLLLVLSVVLFVDSSDDELAPGAVFLVLLLLGALFSMHFFTARAAFQRKNGARIASLVIAVPLLLGFPLGTLIGLYLLENAWKPWDGPVNPAQSTPTAPTL